MRSSRLVFIVALLLLVIFFVFSRERTRPFIGHHDWDNVTWVSVAENYQRYGLVDTRLAQIRNTQPADESEWNIYQNHPPGISVLTFLTIETIGNTAFTARLLPIFATMLTLALFFAIVRHMHDKRTALLSLFFFGLSPLLIYFSGKIGHEQFTLLLILIFLTINQRRHHFSPSAQHGIFALLGFLGTFIGWGWYLFVAIYLFFVWWQGHWAYVRTYFALALGTAAGGTAFLALSVLQEPEFFQTLLDAFLIRSTNTDNAKPISALSWFAIMGSRLLWLATPVVPVFAALLAFVTWRATQKPADAFQPGGMMVLFISGILFVALLWQGAYIHNYYLYYVFAPLSVWAAAGFFKVLYAYGTPPKTLWQIPMIALLIAFVAGSSRWGTELFAHDVNEERYTWGIEAGQLIAEDEIIIANLPPLGPHIGYYARRVVQYEVYEEDFLQEPRPDNWGLYIFCTEDETPEWLEAYAYTYDDKTQCYFVDLHPDN